VSKTALSHKDIHRLTNEAFDRVTIYRTLDSFVKAAIIHEVPSVDFAIRYALVDDKAGSNRKGHPHFLCETCGKTLCMKDTELPVVLSPRGFVLMKVELVMRGICDCCYQP